MDIHSEAFESLLAEALRSGPGSPPWRQAVEVLRDAGTDGEEYAMLCRAREDLESGKDYRSVRAGAGFTRKLMEKIENERPPQWALPTASLIAMLATGVIVIVIAAVCWLIFVPAHHAATVAELQEAFLVTPVLDVRFDSAMPEGLSKIGILPLVARDGLRLSASPQSSPQYVGAGVCAAQGLAADVTYGIELNIDVENAHAEAMTQLFIAETGVFGAQTSLAAHELVCVLEPGMLRIIPADGHTAAEVPLVVQKNSATLKLRLNGTLAMVEQGGRVIWSGSHRLNPAAERHVGVRYLTRGGANGQGVTIRSLRVMKP
jgi:hypothetical protein